MSIGKMLLVAVAIVSIYYLYLNFMDGSIPIPNFGALTGGAKEAASETESKSESEETVAPSNDTVSSNLDAESQEEPKPIDPVADLGKVGCMARERLTSKDLLPKEGSNMWADQNPEPEGMKKDMMQAGHHLGNLTTTSENRIANQQLRSDPSIPRVPTGPWNQTTVQPDKWRRPFEIS